ncbi:MAG: DUF523 and DUF1722 domain-containing protein [bacterium]|nr:MAG: DUF523 and DUF1722 domain-containing protein [bacterium]
MKKSRHKDERLRVGISTCLLGENVRWDGGHQLDRYLADTLGKFVEYVPVCPEVECGFPIPREPFHLEGDPERPRLITSRTGVDHTERMERWARKRVEELEGEELCGFIFKSNSPSSGMERVKVRNEKGMPVKKGRGIFARVFMEHFPTLPVEEDGRLHDIQLRENFVERIFTLKRWREMVKERGSRGGLVEFHTRHKMLILSHSPQLYREMGKLVAGGGGYALAELFDRYRDLLTEAMKLKTTAKKNSNVLEHALGYFKKVLSPDEKREMLEVIEEYRLGYVPLIVPVTLVNHYVRKYDQPYLREQYYLNPHPLELALRNHV